MKGIILAGGTGSRLMPSTAVTNKHLLQVYNQPMINYPLRSLLELGLQDIMVVTGPDYADHFSRYLGEHGEFLRERLEQGGLDVPNRLDVIVHYAIQKEAGGIAQALGLCRDFAGNDSIAVILGDNIFDPTPRLTGYNENAAVIFIKDVADPQRFGVATLDEKGKVVSIEEKPTIPKSSLAVTGFYVYPHSVFDIIDTLKPSGRGELEITDVNNAFIKEGTMEARVLDGFWSDAGTPESLHRASEYFYRQHNL